MNFGVKGISFMDVHVVNFTGHRCGGEAPGQGQTKDCRAVKGRG